MDIKKRVNTLVRKHQTRNPFDIIRGLNAIVVFAPLSGVRGFYQYFQRNNIIYIDESLPEHEKHLFVPTNSGICCSTKKPMHCLWIAEPT